MRTSTYRDKEIEIIMKNIQIEHDNIHRFLNIEIRKIVRQMEGKVSER